MKAKILLQVIILNVVFACSSDEKVNEIVDEGVLSGAFIRTLSFTNSDLILGDANSTFKVALEVQDEQEGSLLENIEVLARFKDNNQDNGDQSSSEVVVKTINREDFTNSSDNLPLTNLELTYAELIDATNVLVESVQCKDQFLVRLELNLNDGRSFSINDSSSSAVIAFDTIFSSPFCYTLNIVEPIAASMFVGTYEYRSVQDGPIGPTFGRPGTVTIRVGESVNTRIFEADYIVSRQNEASRSYRFVVSCDEIIFRKNQISSFFSWCPPGGGFTFGGPPILLGPDTTNATINPEDDAVFELHILEGYLGWDGDCGFGTVPAKIQFTKQ